MKLATVFSITLILLGCVNDKEVIHDKSVQITMPTREPVDRLANSEQLGISDWEYAALEATRLAEKREAQMAALTDFERLATTGQFRRPEDIQRYRFGDLSRLQSMLADVDWVEYWHYIARSIGMAADKKAALDLMAYVKTPDPPEGIAGYGEWMNARRSAIGGLGHALIDQNIPEVLQFLENLTDPHYVRTLNFGDESGVARVQDSAFYALSLVGADQVPVIMERKRELAQKRKDGVVMDTVVRTISPPREIKSMPVSVVPRLTEGVERKFLDPELENRILEHGLHALNQALKTDGATDPELPSGERLSLLKSRVEEMERLAYRVDRENADPLRRNLNRLERLAVPMGRISPPAREEVLPYRFTDTFRLRAMLRDPVWLEYWPSILTTIGMVADEKAARDLIDFIKQSTLPSGYEQAASDARLYAIKALGYILIDQDVPEVLAFLDRLTDITYAETLRFSHGTSARAARYDAFLALSIANTEKSLALLERLEAQAKEQKQQILAQSLSSFWHKPSTEEKEIDRDIRLLEVYLRDKRRWCKEDVAEFQKNQPCNSLGDTKPLPDKQRLECMPIVLAIKKQLKLFKSVIAFGAFLSADAAGSWATIPDKDLYCGVDMIVAGVLSDVKVRYMTVTAGSGENAMEWYMDLGYITNARALKGKKILSEEGVPVLFDSKDQTGPFRHMKKTHSEGESGIWLIAQRDQYTGHRHLYVPDNPISFEEEKNIVRIISEHQCD